MKVTVKELFTRKDLRQFVEYPNKLYKNNPYYVPQLISADLDTLDKNKNHAFEYCESRYWMAYDEAGKPVGRIAAIINHNYNEKTNQKQCRFGFMDFIDDDDVVDALLAKVEEWAREKGMDNLNGPLGFLEFDASGVLVDGFTEIPTAYGKYNDPYYEPHMLKRGFVKDVDWIEMLVNIPYPLPDEYARVSDLVKKRYKLHTQKIRNKKEMVRTFDEMADLLNRTYRNIHGFSELTKGQIEDLKKQFVPNLRPDFVCVVRNEENKMVGFGICLPSIAKALQKAKGHLFPFGFIHLLRALNHNEILDTLLIGIDDEYKSKGVNAIIFDSTSFIIKKYGIKYVETTRELETNISVQNLWNKFEYRIHKRARCYIKQL